MNVYRNSTVAIVLISICASLCADRLTIHNRTPRDLYIGIYYLGMKLPFKDQPNGIRAIGPQLIESDSSGIIERPERKIGVDRELVFVEDKELLLPQLTKEQLDKYHSKNVGSLQGDVFYIGDKDGEFYGYTTAEWNVVKAIIEAARNKVIGTLGAITENPYKQKTAQVRMGNQLPSSEKEFLVQRKQKVKKGFEQLIGKSIDAVPTVAIVCSGGGYRAMLYTAGALLGAQNTGIMDCTTYMVGLSGSTWAISGWVLSGKPINTYYDWLINHVNLGLKKINSDDVKLIGDHLLTKYFFDCPFDIVDLYGSLLANELFAEFGPYKQRQTLSGQVERVKSAQIPFPIYTAIAAHSPSAENLWYEFTPYEIGAPWLSAYVPSWAFGRKFKKGSSVNFAPEQNFGVLLGTFGLAPGVTVARLVKEIDFDNKVNSTFVKNIIDRILEDQGHRRITSSDFFNFTLEMPNSAITNERILKLVDAGINFNLPYPPISGERPERKADIIIFVDASGDNLAGDLRKAEEYAISKRLRFPPIDYVNIDKKGVSIFKTDRDPQTPIVIYIPRIVDKQLLNKFRTEPAFKNVIPLIENFDIEACLKDGPCATFNFKYTPEQARTLAGLGIFNMMAAKDAFIRAVELKSQIAIPT